MRHHQRVFFGATGFVAASLTLATLGVGANAAWAAGQGKGNSGRAGSGSNQPAGNNGTVKIDEYTVDSGQDNDPHVGCGFTVSFYGYDGSQTQYATINVTPVAPTSGGSDFSTRTSWTVDSRTGGSQLDQQVRVSGQQLAPHLSGVTPQANQGYHLRLEVEVTGSQGSDDKYKVFWMEPCGSSGSSASQRVAPSTKYTGTGMSTGTGSTGVSVGRTNAGPVATTRPAAAPTPASVASSGSRSVSGASASGAPTGSGTPPSGSSLASAARVGEVASATRAVAASAPFGVLPNDQSATVATSAGRPSGGSLAFTGASIGVLVALGVGLIASGLLLTRRWRRTNT